MLPCPAASRAPGPALLDDGPGHPEAGGDPVRLAEVQRLYGIAASMGRKGLFFSAAGYTPAAREWAKKHRVECYRYPPCVRVC